MTPNDLFDSYCNYQHAHMAFFTYYCRKCLLQRHFLPEYGNTPWSDLSPCDVDSIYDHMEASGYAINTTYAFYAALNSFVNFAISSGFSGPNPVEQARRIRPVIFNQSPKRRLYNHPANDTDSSCCHERRDRI